MTFKEAEAAKKACEDATPVINGRRANCNLASLGARRPRSSSSTPPQHGMLIYYHCRFVIITFTTLKSITLGEINRTNALILGRTSCL